MFVDNQDNKNSTPGFINSKTKSKLTGSETFSKPRTKNPIDELELIDDNQSIIEAEGFPYKNLKLALIVLFLIAFSFILNPFFSKNIEPVILKFCTLSFSKPYILTSGEFKTFAIAKEKAIKLLPELKQININQLNSGAYIFEIDKFSSKEVAYREAAKLKQDGFESVHVRYLPD